MIAFTKAIVFDLSSKIGKLLHNLSQKALIPELDRRFYDQTVSLLTDLENDIRMLINSGYLDIPSLTNNNIITYNTFFERLSTIEVFRYLIIMNFGEAEIYFKNLIRRIYKEVHLIPDPPIITTISNSENYYWALPSYDIIAVPTGEEKCLLNLPDLFHEMGHLIYNQSATFLKQNIDSIIEKFYQDESQRILNEGRPPQLITLFRQKKNDWLDSWVMEFSCDLIAAYLVGPAYAWTNLKLSTLSANDKLFRDSPSHPSDEARMRAIFYMLRKLGHTNEMTEITSYWDEFLLATNNPRPSNYDYIFPQVLIEKLADAIAQGCADLDLQPYSEQVREFGNPISKVLNDAWVKVINDPDQFIFWEAQIVNSIKSEAF